MATGEEARGDRQTDSLKPSLGQGGSRLLLGLRRPEEGLQEGPQEALRRALRRAFRRALRRPQEP